MMWELRVGRRAFHTSHQPQCARFMGRAPSEVLLALQPPAAGAQPPPDVTASVTATVDKNDKTSLRPPSPNTSATNVGSPNRRREKERESAAEDSESDSDDEAEQDNEIRDSDIVHNTVISQLICRMLTAPLVVDPFHVIDKVKHPKAEPGKIVSVHITAEEIREVCRVGTDSFLAQKSLLRLDKTHLPVTVCGDIHGSFDQIRVIFRQLGAPFSRTYLFLGDYVDRGVQGLEAVLLLVCLKIRYPNKVFLLRGNHEDANTNLSYGFYDECLVRFPGLDKSKPHPGEQIWRLFVALFNAMPVAALISPHILCMHGGISPYINTLDDIDKIERPAIVPPFGAMTDLLWSDPETKYTTWTQSHRGISFAFGEEQFNKFCDRNDIHLVIRGHQIDREMYRHGYRWWFSGQRLVTIFSAANYQNYKNNSCVITINKKMKLRFTVFRCRNWTKNGKSARSNRNRTKGKGAADTGSEKPATAKDETSQRKKSGDQKKSSPKKSKKTASEKSNSDKDDDCC